MYRAPMLWTTVDHRLDGLRVSVRGELSAATAPALDSLLRAVVTEREPTVVLDLREARLVPPAADALLQRWSASPTATAGVHELRRRTSLAAA